MSEKRMSFEDLLASDDEIFEDVETPRGTVRIGVMSSESAIEWIDDNDNPERNKYSGLRCVVKSIINVDGKHVGEDLSREDRRALEDQILAGLVKRNYRTNGTLVERALIVNGFRKEKDKPSAGDALKNVSGETETSVSPSDSPAS